MPSRLHNVVSTRMGGDKIRSEHVYHDRQIMASSWALRQPNPPVVDKAPPRLLRDLAGRFTATLRALQLLRAQLLLP